MKRIKLCSVRGVIATSLTLCLIYLFVTNTAEHISEFIAIYMCVLNYLFKDKDETIKGSGKDE